MANPRGRPKKVHMDGTVAAPAKPVKKVHKGANTAEAVTWTDFIRVQNELLAAERWRELLVWVIGGYTAFRVSDFADLTWGDILGKESLDVNEKKKRWLSKPARSVVFGEEALALIEECRKRINPQSRPDFCLFRGTRGPRSECKAMHRVSIWELLQRVAKRHGLNQQISPHSLRKCFALRVWVTLGGNDAAMTYLSALLCHSSTDVTKRYLGITKRVHAQIYRNLAKDPIVPRPGFTHIEELYAQINAVQ